MTPTPLRPRESEPRKRRSPNRWLLYGFFLGLLLGYAIGMWPLGIGVGLFIGMMLRNRDVEEAMEIAAEAAEHMPRPDDNIH